MNLEEQISSAVVAHARWDSTFRNAVDAEKLDILILLMKNDNWHDYTKWFYGPTITEEQKTSNRYQIVRWLLGVFHEKAEKVANLVISGKKVDAEQMLGMDGEYTQASAALTRAMMAWQSEVE
jgi:hypothetical protein